MELVEIGLIMIGRLEASHRQAIETARERLQAWLYKLFPSFHWQIRLLQRDDVPLSIRQEPSALLRDGSNLRESEGWDFALLFTSADLISRYQPFAFAATSSALDLAVISTNRLDPKGYDTPTSERQRIEVLTNRLVVLCQRSLGHLSGLPNSKDPGNIMGSPVTPNSLECAQNLDADQKSAMQNNLSLVADPRLEETNVSRDFSKFRFYARSAWINRHEVLDAVLHAKPWQFPFRLLRLSAAALSTMIVLMITAETWHLAATQDLTKLGSILFGALATTTVFVIAKQNLFVHKLTLNITEQTVISNVSAFIIVLLGMITSLIVLMSICLAFSALLYSPELVGQWANSNAEFIDISHYLKTAALVTTLSLLIGALGASFEAQHYFRHVVFVDEEL